MTGLVPEAMSLAPPILRIDEPPAKSRFSLSTGAGRGVESLDMIMAGIRTDLLWAKGWKRWGASTAWITTVPLSSEMEAARAQLIVGRALVGVGNKSFDATIGPALVFFNAAEAPDKVATGMSGSLRYCLLVWRSGRLKAGVDVDFFQHRLVGRVRAVDVVATPRISLQGMVGFEWGDQ